MERRLMRELFGLPATGNTDTEIGSGSQAIGKGLQGLMAFGFPATGKKDEGVGSGSKDTGNTVKKFQVARFMFQVLNFKGSSKN